MRQWTKAEALLRAAVGSVLSNELDRDTLGKLKFAQQMREQIMYSDSWPSEEELTRAGLFLQSILENLSALPEIEDALGPELRSANNL